MDRRRFLLTSLAGVIGAPLAAEAQPVPVRRIGVVESQAKVLGEARREGLRRLGWIEGENIVVEHGGDAFAVDATSPSRAVRVSLGAAPSREALTRALEKLAAVLHEDPEPLRPAR